MREQQQQQKRQQRQQRQGAEKKPKIRYYQAMNDQADQSRSGYGTRRAPLPGRGRVERRPSAEMSLLCDDRDSDDTRDHKSTRRSTLLHVTGFIIVTEFCERLAYYGFAGSLVLLFETQLGMSNAEADTQYALWSGLCYVTPLLGGWVADSYLGRYNSILLFSSLYLVGLFVAAGACVPGHVSPLLLFPAIYLLALGTGGIKASVSVFGADQFDDKDPRDALEKQSFFNWFYWSINLGALVSYTLVSYVCQNGLGFLGGRDWGFMAGYSIPCVAMTIAILVFIAGTPRYRRLPPTGSVVGRAAGIVAQALKKAAGSRAGANSLNAESDSDTHGAYRVADGAGGEDSAGDRSGGSVDGKRRARGWWLQKASEAEGGSYPDDEVAAVSQVYKLLPFLVLQVPYWAVYSQMSTAFQNQGCQMQLNVSGFDIPVSALNMFDTLSILLLIPIVDRGVYPWLQRCGWEPTMLRKMGAGLLLAGCAVLVAAGVEILRRRGVGDGDVTELSPCRRERDYDPSTFQDYWKSRKSSKPAYRPTYCHQIQGCDELGPDGLLEFSCIDCEAPPVSSDLNVLWQIPQYLLIGASEILASVTSLEFFYAEAPSTMRGLSAGLNLLTTAFGSWITVPLLNLVNSGAFGDAWVPDDLNDGHLELYFYLLAGLVAFSFACFVVVANGYTYKADVTVSPAGSSTSTTTARTVNLLSDMENDMDEVNSLLDPEGTTESAGERGGDGGGGAPGGDLRGASKKWESPNLLSQQQEQQQPRPVSGSSFGRT